MRGMKPLPMPLRLAAGLVATALEEAQELPRKLVELPVTAVSQALQVSMRVQQRVTELAIKGDRALGALRPVPETPSWARFDEDEFPPPHPGNGLAAVARAEVARPWAVDEPAPPRRVTPVRVVPEPVPSTTESDVPAPRDPEPAASTPPAPKPAATKPAAAKLAMPKPASTPAATPSDTAAASEPPAATAAAAEPASAAPADEAPSTNGAPAGFEDYEQWSLPQLRGRFRKLSLDEVQQLLRWENAHQNRPPYVTMLSNRVASITGR